MGLIKLNEGKETEVPESSEGFTRRVDVREELSEDTGKIIEMLTVMLNHLNLDYIRLEKGVIEYRHYPDYNKEE